MTTKEAIAYLDQRGWRVDSHAGLCADFIINALRASQKREREVFTCLRDSCEHYGNFSGECYYSKCVEKSYKCTMRSCPLLAKQKKESK